MSVFYLVCFILYYLCGSFCGYPHNNISYYTTTTYLECIHNRTNLENQVVRTRKKYSTTTPPPSGYVIFVARMTTKIRHDHPNERRNQTQVIRKISKICKFGMTEPDREYYMIFCKEAREEYEYQYKEFRATGDSTFRVKILRKCKMSDPGCGWIGTKKMR
mmetsp:Transcript_26728/g.37548  ORF Transcript_26728/g.37548 Transcript_26728/m.37548 type:complete len:161 (+) Transcript_26728:556-1038(+)